MKKATTFRSTVGTGLTWAFAWSVIGTTVLWVAGTALAEVVSQINPLAGAGFVGGVAFSVALGTTEGRRRFYEMSLPRFAAWGAGVGLLLSMAFGGAGWPPTETGSLFVGIVTLMGAGSAAGSLALARMAEDRELLEAGEEALGLTEGG